MLLRVRRQIIAALMDRFADPDRGHRVLQRLARAHVHHDFAERDDGHVAAARDEFDRAAMQVVHRALMEHEADPCRSA